MRDLPSLRIEEIAVWMTPSDMIFGHIERHLFAALVEEPGAVSRRTGEAASA